jgi:hypothetical protein
LEVPNFITGQTISALTHEIATPRERTVTSLEFIITRCWDGLAVHVRTVGRFKIDDKRPITIVSTHTDGEGARDLLYDAFGIAKFVLLLNEPVY